MQESAMSRLERFRIDRGLTKAELAERAGVSRDVVTAIELRKPRRVRSLTLARLARALGVGVEELMEDAA